MRSLVVGADADVKIGSDVDDTETRNQVALHRAGERDVEPAGDEVDQERNLSRPLCAGQQEAVAAERAWA